jgi:hypothetical protein
MISLVKICVIRGCSFFRGNRMYIHLKLLSRFWLPRILLIAPNDFSSENLCNSWLKLFGSNGLVLQIHA